MTQPGTVFTAENAKEYLKNYNKNYSGEKTWLEAFKAIDENYADTTYNLSKYAGENVSSLDTNESAMQAANLQDYSKNITEAYKNAMIQRNQIANAKLSQYASGKMLNEIDSNLDNAYNMYLQNYLQNKQNISSNFLDSISSINSNYQKGMSEAYNIWDTMTNAVNDELDVQSKNTADYLNAHFDYLKALYEKNHDLFVEDQFQDYVNRGLVEGKLEVTGLKDLSAIRDSMFDIDKDGNHILNERGQDFFKQMQQLGMEKDGYSFGSYLYDTNKDLYEWSISANPYDSVKDAHGNSNRASALGAIGLADDEGYINDGDYKWKGGTVLDNYYNNKMQGVDTKGGRLITFESSLGPIKRLQSKNKNTYSTGNKMIDDTIGTSNTYFEITSIDEKDDGYIELQFANDDNKLVKEKFKLGTITDDEFLTEFDKGVNSIKNNAIYYYDGQIYLGIVDESTGQKRLRKVLKNNTNGENYNSFVNRFENPEIIFDVDKDGIIDKEESLVPLNPSSVSESKKHNSHLTNVMPPVIDTIRNSNNTANMSEDEYLLMLLEKAAEIEKMESEKTDTTNSKFAKPTPKKVIKN